MPVRARPEKNIAYFIDLLKKRAENAVIGITRLAQVHK